MRCHGVLADGRVVDSALSDAAVGRPLDGGKWWAKLRLPSGALLVSRGEGYSVFNDERTAEDDIR